MTENRRTTFIGSSITKSEDMIVLWNRSKMQCSAFIAILEPQNVYLLCFPSGSERGLPSCFHLLGVLQSWILVLQQFALVKWETRMKRSLGCVCVRFGFGQWEAGRESTCARTKS